MSNKFKDELSLDAEQWKSAKKSIEESILDNCKYYNLKYNNKISQNYFHNIVATIMLEQHKKYGTDIHIPYRFKSPKSLLDKTIDYIGRNDEQNNIQYNPSNNEWKVNLKTIKDMFAMKIVAYTRKPIFSSSDPELSKLIEEKKQNYEFLSKMQEFSYTKIIKGEYEKEREYIYKSTKLEYYKNCKEILEKIKTLLPIKATKLIAHYNELLDTNNKIIALLEANGIEQELITKRDIDILNFCDILEDFSERIHDKIDLKILTKQITSVFENSELLKELGVKIVGYTEKRTQNGYVANFLEIETLIGNIECQLQSKHEYEDGNYGFAAHTKLDSKYINPYKLPDINNKNEIQQFRDNVEFISPIGFLAEMDTLDKNRVVIQTTSKYQNYKNVISQIAKDSDFQEYMLIYFSKLYPNRNKLFKESSSDMGFMRFDIEEYINSEEFMQLKKENQKETTRDD